MNIMVSTLRHSIVLDAHGIGYIAISSLGETWMVKKSTVRASSAVRQAACAIYKNHIYEKAIETTASGSTGDTTDTEYAIEPTDVLIFVWSGGDSGAVASLDIDYEVIRHAVQ